MTRLCNQVQIVLIEKSSVKPFYQSIKIHSPTIVCFMTLDPTRPDKEWGISWQIQPDSTSRSLSKLKSYLRFVIYGTICVMVG